MNRSEDMKSIQMGMALIYAYGLWLFFRFVSELFGSYELIPSIWKLFMLQWLIFGICLSLIQNKMNKMQAIVLFTGAGLLGSALLFENHWQALGQVVFTLVYGMYLAGNLTGERDLYFKFKKGDKVRNVTIALLILLTWLKETTNFYGLGVSIGSVVVYGFLNAYVLNAYEWYLKWQYLEGSLAGKERDSLIQIDHSLGQMERENRKWALLSLGCASLVGALLLVVVKGLLNSGLGHYLYQAFLWIVTLLASLVLGVLGLDVPRDLVGETQVQNPAKTVEQIALAGKKTGAVDYQGAYQYGTIILLGFLAVGLAYWLVKKAQKGGKLPQILESRLASPKENLYRPEEKEILLKPYIDMKPEKVDSLIRKRYLALLKRLEANGISILPNQTPDELKSQFALIYKGQEALIDLITEAYCERRYGDRDATKMAQALVAFEQLKEVKHD